MGVRAFLVIKVIKSLTVLLIFDLNSLKIIRRFEPFYEILNIRMVSIFAY
jgi:hypothetical protein